MKNNYMSDIWSDNWCIEKENAWFVIGVENILVNLNLETYQFESMVYIPDASPLKFRLNPYCIRIGNDIFCMPDQGSSIWIYHLDTENFSEIHINNPNNIRLSICYFWLYENTIYAVSNGLKQIIEINVAEKKLENYYTLCEKGSLTKSIKDGDSIYSLSGESRKIYEFNLRTKKITTHNLPDIQRNLFTLCFDGNKFWLSGYKKELYIWEKDNKTIRVIDEFPKGFGSYNFTKETDGKVDCETEEYEIPTFLYSVLINGSAWFIPYQTNQILYWDKEDDQIKVFEIEEEIETKESLLGRKSLFSKYIVEYIREDRYLGLFSLKNNCILEIDTIEKKTDMKYYSISNECMDKMIHENEGNIFFEGVMFHKHFFAHALNDQNKSKKSNLDFNIGMKIHRVI